MRSLGLQGVIRGKPIRTTFGDKTVVCPLDRVNRDFSAPRPNALWVSDFTYVSTWGGFVYVAFVIDTFARRIVGWRVSRTAHAGFVLDALEQALHDRRPIHDGGLVHHSDRGSQYCSDAYRKLLETFGFTASMSEKGNCYDNAMVETVFITLKSELIWRTVFKTRSQAENAIGQYIDAFYNPRRRHSALGYKSPIQFESEALKLAP